MSLVALFAAQLLATGLYLVLSARLTHRVLGAALIGQGIPLFIISLTDSTPIIESLAIIVIPLCLGVFLALIMRLRRRRS